MQLFDTLHFVHVQIDMTVDYALGLFFDKYRKIPNKQCRRLWIGMVRIFWLDGGSENANDKLSSFIFRADVQWTAWQHTNIFQTKFWLDLISIRYTSSILLDIYKLLVINIQVKLASVLVGVAKHGPSCRTQWHCDAVSTREQGGSQTEIGLLPGSLLPD